MALRDWLPWRRNSDAVAEEIIEAAGTGKTPARQGFEYGISQMGLTETNQSLGAATQTDRRTLMQQLYESFLACPWSWASVQTISRTITAGGLVTDWDTDDGEGDQDAPDKPANVQALERLLAYCNPTSDIRQLTRNIIADLLVFGDAFVEVVWWGNQPVALYNLDSPTIMPIGDEHGEITKYVQVTEFGQRAEFEPREVIHIALDAPRSGVFGVSPTQAALLPITSWLFASSTGKEMFRKGLPMQLHVDFPAGTQQSEQNRWVSMFKVRNLGPRNIGSPVVTRGGATLKELAAGRVADVETFLSQKRDEILACYGVPPAKAGVIESGNLGGGTGEAQHRTFMINTCQPIAELVLEKLNFHIAREGFGIEGWHLKFLDVDLRDSKTIEEIRDMRLRNGSWTLNKYRAEIGEPPVEGGDNPVLIDRQNLVKWADMDAMSQASVAFKLKGTVLEPGPPQHGQPVSLEKPEPAPVPDVLKPFAGKSHQPADDQHGQEPSDGQDGERPDDTPEESLQATQISRYRARLREAYTALGIREAA